MQKINHRIILIMSIIIALFSLTAYAEQSAVIQNITKNIVIKGQLTAEYAEKNVSILLKKPSDQFRQEDIGYVCQTKVNNDGSYYHKFKFEGDINAYKLYVSAEKGDVTESVVEASASNEIINVDVSLGEIPESLMKLDAVMDNVYGDDLMFVLVLAFYDDTDKLISCKASVQNQLSYTAKNEVREFMADIPAFACKVKAFIWSDYASAVPLADHSEKFVTGTKGTFYAYAWHQPTGSENLSQMFWIHNKSYNVSTSANASEASATTYNSTPLQMAQKMKTFMENRPKGSRVLMPYLSGIILDTGENFYWWDVGIGQNINILDSVLAQYKQIGGPEIDACILDYEVNCSVWAVEQGQLRMTGTVISDAEVEQLYSKIIADSRYATDIRPQLQAKGFEFYTGSDHNELYYIYKNKSSGTPNTLAKKNLYLGVLHADSVRHRYLSQIYNKVKEYYPNIKFSNYQDASTSGDTTLIRPYAHNYQMFTTAPAKQDRLASPVGTHSAPYIYGGIMPSTIAYPPASYPFGTFKKTPFNAFFMEIRRIQDIVTYVDNAKFQPWIGNYTWDFNDNNPLACTDYYKELIYHVGLNDPDSFLFFNEFRNEYSWGNDDQMLSQLLYELDEVAGYTNHKRLTEAVTPIDARYILTGMNAGGKNVWRITPDLYTEGVTIENFLIDVQTPTFKIGNQYIKFPQGSYIYHTQNESTSYGSKYGYWVVSPECTRPEVYRDTSIPPPSETTYNFVANYEMNQRKSELGITQ